MNAMILCAGLGTRLRPLTERIPKPLVPIFDRPVADYTLESLVAAGAKNVVINLHHLPEMVEAHFKENSRGAHISFSHEKEILGAVGGVRTALQFFTDDEPLVVVNGDILIDIDYNELLSTHVSSGAALTMTLGKIPDRPNLHVVGADPESGKLLRIRDMLLPGSEKAESFVNLGAFVYDREILERYVPAGTDFGFADQLIPILFKNGHRISAFISDGNWNDIGSKESYLSAHFDVFNNEGFPPAAIEAGKCCMDVKKKVFIGNNADVSPDAEIGAYSVIGADSKIGAGSIISGCVVIPGTEIPPGTEVKNEIIF